MKLPEYKLYAIRYATRSGNRRDNFLGGDLHDGPMSMDYFVWVAVGEERAFVIDTGFTEETAIKRKREFLRCPIDSLELVGVSAQTVADVILTHLHYDHAGNLARFPNAKFHLQEPELLYAVGRYMQHSRLSHGYNVDDVTQFVRLNYKERVRFYHGNAELAPGITIHPVGGHTAGLQFVRVHTRRGWVAIASDATHYYENIETRRPFTSAFHVGEMIEAFETVRSSVASPQHIVPGHDPEVVRRYPAPSPELAGAVMVLDSEPSE